MSKFAEFRGCDTRPELVRIDLNAGFGSENVRVGTNERPARGDTNVSGSQGGHDHSGRPGLRPAFKGAERAAYAADNGADAPATATRCCRSPHLATHKLLVKTFRREVVSIRHAAPASRSLI
jgi:hypothetical protein